MNVLLTVDVSDIVRNLDRLRTAVEAEALEAAAFAGGRVIADEWQLLFRAAEDAAVPGLPPRAQTGAYRDSIDVHPDERDVESASVVVGSVLPEQYPVFLEYGTVKMAAYPIARPAYEIGKDAADAAVKDTLIAGIHGATT